MTTKKITEYGQIKLDGQSECQVACGGSRMSSGGCR